MPRPGEVVKKFEELYAKSPQEATAGSVWIVLFLSSLDYIYLAMSCFMPWDFIDV